MTSETAPVESVNQHHTLPDPIAFRDFCDSNSERRPALIDGYLRRGETAIVNSASKAGKSHFIGNLALCVATGRPWLGQQTQQGRVLLMDNELHGSDLAYRLRSIADAMQICDHELDESLEVLLLRGRLADVLAISERLQSLDPDTYSMVVIDALYRIFPSGMNENDNNAVTGVFNRIDAIAERLNAGIVLVHHASKGHQGDKLAIDLGSGAGALARAPDCVLSLRDHATDGYSVLETSCRSFAKPPALSIKFDWPMWYAVTLEPELKRARSRTEKTAKDDRDADALLLTALTGERWLSESQLVRITGMGPSRVSRAIGRAVTAQSIDSRRVRRTGRRVAVYRASATANATANNHPS